MCRRNKVILGGQEGPPGRRLKVWPLRTERGEGEDLPKREAV